MAENKVSGSPGALDFVQRTGLKELGHSVSETGFFPSSGEGRKTPTILGLLERANLNHWTTLFI
jgi:hypothetical protein